MKAGAENRKKTVLLGVLGAVAVCGLLYNLYALFGPGATPPPTVAPVNQAALTTARGGTSVRSTTATGGRVSSNTAAAGVPAQKLASTSAGLDPTLDQAAMLRTESLVYSGSGRNIFSATYTPVAVATLPTHVPPPRPVARPGPPPPPPGPPPPPAIPLKFFGTAQRARGAKQIFLLSGEDVYLAKVGDIVAKRFKVDQIMANSVQVTDLVNNNTQTLPMQMQ